MLLSIKDIINRMHALSDITVLIIDKTSRNPTKEYELSELKLNNDITKIKIKDWYLAQINYNNKLILHIFI